MANPFEDSDDDIKMEGFICPICKIDLKDIEFLKNHFEEKHLEEKDLLQSFKDIFSKAKKKILNFDENELGRTLNNSLQIISGNTQEFVVLNNIPQDPGESCDHISYFKAIRNPRLERYATETNKLIIRLNKLLTNRPKDPNEIKQHEQNLVPWIDGKLVKLCPSCAKSFHLARRQHHCRICGSIMCNDCSLFLDLEDANSIINPSYDKTESSRPETSGAEKESVDSIRLCEHCLHLLENRKEMQDSRSDRPLITKLYERLQKTKTDVIPDLTMYEKIIDSLYDGDSVYTLNDASALRGKIGHLAEVIDSLSKEILALKCQKGSRQEALQKSIRMSSVKFIKDNMLSIQPIPMEDEIKRIQQKRINELSMKIERDRRLAQEAFERYELGSGSESSATHSGAKTKTGLAMTTIDNWSGSQQVTGQFNNDPLVEQIVIIKNYIKQARDAMRFEEVETLEYNLRELQHEFYLRQEKLQHSPEIQQ